MLFASVAIGNEGPNRHCCKCLTVVDSTIVRWDNSGRVGISAVGWVPVRSVVELVSGLEVSWDWSWSTWDTGCNN